MSEKHSNPKIPRTPAVRTQAQREAARRNGAKSQGPVTPEGKAISRLNSSRHGLSAEQTFALDHESVEDLAEFRNAIIERYQPADQLELDLCIEIAHARWRLHRVWTTETYMLDIRITEQREHVDREWNDPSEGIRLAEAWKSLAGNSPALSLLIRYEARLRRTFERALRDLQQLQRERNQNRDHKGVPVALRAANSDESPSFQNRDHKGAADVSPQQLTPPIQKLQNEPGTGPRLVPAPPKITPIPQADTASDRKHTGSDELPAT